MNVDMLENSPLDSSVNNLMQIPTNGKSNLNIFAPEAQNQNTLCRHV